MALKVGRERCVLSASEVLCLCFALALADENSTAQSGFEYHKEVWPPDWHDGLTMLLASLGLILAASGGIGGGGVLVPLFMLALEHNRCLYMASVKLGTPLSPLSIIDLDIVMLYS